MEEKQSQLNTFIGMGLIFLLLFLWMQYSAPPKKTPEQLAAETAQPAQQPENQPAAAVPTPATPTPATPVPDSVKNAVLSAQFGAFAAASSGQEQFETLENDLVRITFSSKGGRIREVFLKKFARINTDAAGDEEKSPVRLLEDEKNQFGYELAVNGVVNGKVNTADLYFSASKNGNALTFRADAGQGRYFEQSYALAPDGYHLDYQVGGNGLHTVLAQNSARLAWTNYLDK